VLGPLERDRLHGRSRGHDLRHAGQVARVDRGRRRHDALGRRIPRDPQVRREACHPQGRAQIAEDRACLDGGKLVRVPEKHEAPALAKRAQQPVHHGQIDHRRLVDDDHPEGERIVLVPGEAACGRRPAEQAVKGLRGRRDGVQRGFDHVAPGGGEARVDGLLQALRGLAGRRRHGHLPHGHAGPGERAQERHDDRRLARPRASGDEREGRGEPFLHGALLLVGEGGRALGDALQRLADGLRVVDDLVREPLANAAAKALVEHPHPLGVEPVALQHEGGSVARSTDDDPHRIRREGFAGARQKSADRGDVRRGRDELHRIVQPRVDGDPCAAGPHGGQRRCPQRPEGAALGRGQARRRTSDVPAQIGQILELGILRMQRRRGVAREPLASRSEGR
jgi:hypothetical protein